MVQCKRAKPVINVVLVAGRIPTIPANNRNRVATGNRVRTQLYLTVETRLIGIINIVRLGNVRAVIGGLNLNPVQFGVGSLIISNQPMIGPVNGSISGVPAANFYPPRLFSFTLSRLA